MTSIKQSFCLGLYRREGADLDALLGQAAEIGYAAVEIWGRENEPFEQLVGLADKHGLRLASMSGHHSLQDGLNDPGNHDRIERELLESIELAEKCDIPGLICFSGNRDGRSEEEGVENCAAGLRRVAPAAEEAGVNLNLELLNSKVDHPGYQCDNTGFGVRVCEAVDSPRVRLLYDIYHMQIMEGDLIRTITDNIEHIGHFHTAGNPGRGSLDEHQEIYYPAVMRAIADAGYQYYVGHEFSCEGDPVEALREAFRVCDV